MCLSRSACARLTIAYARSSSTATKWNGRMCGPLALIESAPNRPRERARSASLSSQLCPEMLRVSARLTAPDGQVYEQPAELPRVCRLAGIPDSHGHVLGMACEVAPFAPFATVTERA